jgi:hypothetical protein
MNARVVLERVDRVLSGSDDPDDALRTTVRLLAEEPGITWAGIAFVDGGALTLGPGSGETDEPRRTRTPIVFQGETVGELWVDGEADAAFLARVAELVSAHVLIGWDTGGETWEP